MHINNSKDRNNDELASTFKIGILCETLATAVPSCIGAVFTFL